MRRGPFVTVPNLLGHELQPLSFLAPRLAPVRPSTPRFHTRNTAEEHSRDGVHTMLSSGQSNRFSKCSAAASSFINISTFMRREHRRVVNILTRRYTHSDAVPRIVRTADVPPRAPNYKGFEPQLLKSDRASSIKTIPNYPDRLRLWREYIESLSKGKDPEYLRLKHKIVDGYSWTWIKGYAALNSVWDPWPNRSQGGRFFTTPDFHPEVEKWVEYLWKDEPDRDTFAWRFHVWSSEWRSKDGSSRDKTVELLLWLLHTDLTRAVQALEIWTAAYRSAPATVVADALWYIARVERARQVRGHAYNERFVSTFWTIWKQSNRLPYRMHTNMIYLLDLLSTTEQTKILYGNWDPKFLPHFPNMQLRLARDYGRIGRFDRCLDALRRAFEAGVDPQSQYVRDVCTRIVRSLPASSKDRYATLCDISTLLGEFSVELSIFHYNTIMLQNVDEGRKATTPLGLRQEVTTVVPEHLQTTLEIFDMIQESNIQPDEYSYGILLKGCKLSYNKDIHDGIVQLCAEKAEELSNAGIATEYLHYLFLYHKHWETQQRFKILMREFCRFFSTAPLKTLGLIGTSEYKDTSSQQPPTAAILIMLAARLEETANEYHPENWLWSRYLDFRSAVTSAHPILGPLIETPHAHNCFIKAWTMYPNLLKQAPSIIQDMSTDIDPEQLYIPRLNRRLQPAHADIYSWTMLIQGFMAHGQPAVAEKIKEMIDSRGIKPSAVTWHVLAAGYAALQDAPAATQMLLEGEAEGSLDDKTMSFALSMVLAKIHDRPALMKALGRASHQIPREAMKEPAAAPVEPFKIDPRLNDEIKADGVEVEEDDDYFMDDGTAPGTYFDWDEDLARDKLIDMSNPHVARAFDDM